MVIVSFYVVFSLLANIYIFTDPFYYNSLSKKLAIERVTEIISFQRKFQNIGYLFIPFVILIKVSIIAGVIFAGLFLFNQNISYKSCLKITLLAEIVSLISVLVRTVWLIIDMPDTAEAVQYFSPLSIIHLINVENIPKFLFYPL